MAGILVRVGKSTVPYPDNPGLGRPCDDRTARIAIPVTAIRAVATGYSGGVPL